VFANDLAWIGDGSGLVISMFDPSTLSAGQLCTVGYPDGRVRGITNDQNFYADQSVSTDGSTIAAIRFKQEANLWMAEPAGARKVRQITFGSGDEGSVVSFDVAQDSSIIFGMIKDGSAQIWTIGSDGTGQRQITSARTAAFNPAFRPGIGVFYSLVDSGFVIHLWRADANGDNARQLTSGKGEQMRAISPDGRTVLFHRGEAPDILLAVSSDGGQPVSLGPSSRQSGTFSPDGSRILHSFIHEVNGQGTYTPQIIPAKGGGPVVTPPLPPRIINPDWTPDGKGLTYLHASNGQKNLLRLHLDTGKTDEITRFTDGRIRQYRWSPDGKRLLLRRRMHNADNLWVVNADGSNPVAITDFETGDIADIKWSRDEARHLHVAKRSGRRVDSISSRSRHQSRGPY
jgi:Tol biopolymer transport system component